MVKRSFHKICCLLLIVLSFVIALTGCTKGEFKVDFIVDGEIYQTVSTYGEEVIEMPNDPEKEEYIFDGWYLDKDAWEKPFTANSLLDAPLSANMSVYAKWKTVELSNDTQAEFATFEKTGDYEYSLKVSNATETLSLETLVSVNALSSWTLSTDVDGNQTIANKSATLSIGDNTYYVLVTAEDDSTQLYTLKIRRKPVYEIIFDVAGGTSVENQQVEEGGLAVAPETTRVGYDLSGWNYDFTTPITENKTIVASWTIKEYTITYHLEDNSVTTDNPTTYTIESGEITLTNPTREGYTFDGWYTSSTFQADSKVTVIPTGSTGDLKLYAKWTAITSGDGKDINALISKLEEAGIRNVSFLGDSITTFKGWSNNTAYNSTIGGNAVHYTTTKTESIKSVNDTWWKQLLDITNTNLCVNNAYSGDRVTTRAVDRALQLHDDVGNPDNGIINPDLIFVYLGVNDFNHSVNLQTFKETYDKMICGMMDKYSGAKIYIGTILPNARRVAPTVLDQFNAAIREIAEKYKIGLIDFYNDSGITASNMSKYYWETTASQRLHPNALGMDVMTETVLNKLIEDFIG